MIHPDYLSNDWFDKGNKERVQLGDKVEKRGSMINVEQITVIYPNEKIGCIYSLHDQWE